MCFVSDVIVKCVCVCVWTNPGCDRVFIQLCLHSLCLNTRKQHLISPQMLLPVTGDWADINSDWFCSCRCGNARMSWQNSSFNINLHDPVTRFFTAPLRACVFISSFLKLLVHPLFLGIPDDCNESECVLTGRRCLSGCDEDGTEAARWNVSPFHWEKKEWLHFRLSFRRDEHRGPAWAHSSLLWFVCEVSIFFFFFSYKRSCNLSKPVHPSEQRTDGIVCFLRSQSKATIFVWNSQLCVN